MAKLNELIGFSLKEYIPENIPHKWDDFFGVELELERVRSPIDGDVFGIPGWTTHSDASLRDGIEYVTARPMGGIVLEEVVDNFFAKNLEWSAGARTSTHIHINVLDVEADVLRSMFLIMYMIEDGIYAAVEEDRKWGGYSVSLQEMDVKRIRSILNPSNPSNFITGICPSRNAERYYGFNTNVRRHGTVEFRYFPGGPSKEELCSWIDLVMMVKSTAKKYSPSDLIEYLSDPSRIQTFLLQNFGSWGEKFLSAYPAQKYYDLFSDIAAMAVDEDVREIMNRVVCIHPHYMNFLSINTFKKKPLAMEYLTNMVRLGNIYAQSDWLNYIAEANNKDKGGRAAPIYEQEDAEQEDSDWGGPEEPQNVEVRMPSSSIQNLVDEFWAEQSRLNDTINPERLRAVTQAVQGYTPMTPPRVGTTRVSPPIAQRPWDQNVWVDDSAESSDEE